ncbi:FAD synthetase family protein [Alkalihalobacillus deserti]|uniref:FAD synthetase family protein n=1 Tax=Alkalihalobacillus deserti TaxID=2879466 RepID=UPI001D145266|nr:FAD synthetase family protein [Alkalihalobacillus deserti]
METIYLNPDNLAYWQHKAKPSIMALGFFDGLHKGHQKVIDTAYEIGKKQNLSLSVMSFFPHPKTVLSNGKKQVNYLMPLSEKEKVLRTLGVDTFFIVEFDKEFSGLSPEQFVSKYLLDLGVVHAVAGFDYTYGFKGEGNMDRIKCDSKGLLEVTKVSKVEHLGEKISSTCIREKLLKGHINDLHDLLGRPYEVECSYDGETLNLRPYYTLPAPGRYAVTMSGECPSQDLEVIISEKKEVITLRPLSELNLDNNARFTITWHRQISKKNAAPFYENRWNYANLVRSVHSG